MVSMLEQGSQVCKQRGATASAKCEVHALQHGVRGTTADALAGKVETAGKYDNLMLHVFIQFFVLWLMHVHYNKPKPSCLSTAFVHISLEHTSPLTTSLSSTSLLTTSY